MHQPLLLALITVASLQGSAVDLTRTFEPALAEHVAARRLPGLAIGVVAGGEVIYAQGFGETRLGSGIPITTKSIFHMASISKPFTATAVMQLVEAGKLELDTPIVTHLPYFRLAEDLSRTITVRQILTHTSGFPDVRDYEWDKPRHDAGAAERYVRSIAGENLLFNPGEGSRYSNMAFDTMGDVIAKVSDLSFEGYVRAHILHPLGMTSSSFIHAETPAELRTQGHSTSFSQRIVPGPCPVYPYNRRHAPSSTLNSNVEDMCRWMLANLARGELAGERILQAESFDIMWSRDDDTPDVGLSWWLEDFEGRPCVLHNGSDTGFSSRCILLPDEGIGVVVMSNSDQASLGGVVTAALHAALGEDFELPSARLAEEFAHKLEDEGVAAAIAHYRALRDTEPEEWDFSFRQLDRVCRMLIRKERFAEAVEVASLNRDAHVEVAAVHARLGQALAAVGSLVDARQAYERALELDPASEVALAGLAGLGK